MKTQPASHLPVPISTIPAAERRWVWMFGIIVMLVTMLPYLVAFSRQGLDWHFTGFLVGVDDGNSYIAKMLAGSAGDWLFRTPYTAYSQRGLMLNFPYLLLGKLAAPPGWHEQLVALYTLFRITAGLMAVHATYDFAALFLPETHWRRFATALAVVGGGFGWLVLFDLRNWFSWGLPLESYSPEAFGFLGIYSFPHLAAARALLLLGLRDFLLRAEAPPSVARILRASALWFGVWLFQPITLVAGMAVIGVYLATTAVLQRWRGLSGGWDAWRRLAAAAAPVMLLALPLAAFAYFSIRLDPVLRGWEGQNLVLSPAPHVFLLGYGVLLPLALAGALPLLRVQLWRGALLAAWLVAAPALAYAPVGIQRRLVDGVWVAIVIMAAAWMAQVGSRLRKLVFAWTSLALPMPLILLAAGLIFSWNPSEPLFRPADEVRVFQFLASTAQAGDIVLAADESANALPAWAPVRSLIGHGPESINGDALRTRVKCFYSDCSPAQRRALLDEFAVRYVLWGPRERALGPWNLSTVTELREIFAYGEYLLFEYQIIE